jgi:hypothetical protein
MATKPTLVGGTWVTSFIAWFPVDPYNFIPRGPIHPTDEQLGTASIIHPGPFAVLGRFRFQADKSFQGRFDRNNLERFEVFPIHGAYEVQPDPEGGYGGEIVLLEDDGNVHMRLKFLFVDNDEINFITSYRAEPEPRRWEDYLQSAAGTMRRSLLVADPVTDPVSDQEHPIDLDDS